MHPLATPLALSDALPVFERWLAEPAAFDGQRNHRAALCLASQLQRGGYAIRRSTDSAPWRLVQDGVTLAVERRGVPEPLPVLYRPGDANIHAYMPDGSVWEVMPCGKPYMVRAPRAYRVALDSKERAA